MFNPDSTLPMVGASGAIAGVMGAYIVRFPHSRILTLVFIFFFVTTFEVPASVMLAYWFLIQLFSGLGSHRAHDMRPRAAGWRGSRTWAVSSPGLVLIKLHGRASSATRAAATSTGRPP